MMDIMFWYRPTALRANPVVKAHCYVKYSQYSNMARSLCGLYWNDSEFLYRPEATWPQCGSCKRHPAVVAAMQA